jgi:regulator of replication initiation timing
MSGDAAQTIQQIDQRTVIEFIEHLVNENKRLKEENACLRKKLADIERNAKGILGLIA